VPGPWLQRFMTKFTTQISELKSDGVIIFCQVDDYT
jgi:hypothetical protein